MATRKINVKSFNGRQLTSKLQEIFKEAFDEAKIMVSQKLVEKNECLTIKHVQNAVDILRSAVTITYPMGLLPHNNIAMEFFHTENSNPKQAEVDVIEPTKAKLWFAGRKNLELMSN